MTITLESLAQIIHPVDKFTVLVGAGISKSPPSNLPTGIDFIHSFYDFLISKEESQFESVIEVLKNHKALRFENIMSLLMKLSYSADIQPLLDCYRECDTFNQNHDLLSALAKSGCATVTTNFDSLLERAYLANGLLPKPIIYDHEFRMSHSSENIYKLHGSVEKYDYKSNAWLDSLDSIRMTLEQVALQGYGFIMSMNKRRFLCEQFRDRNLLVVGYSGFDDFDIVPLLLNTKSEQKIVWLNYDPQDGSVYAGADILHAPEKFGRSGQIIQELIVKGLRNENSCYIVRADALSLLSAIIGARASDYAKSHKQKPSYSVNPSAYFGERLGRILANRELVQIMKATLLMKAEHYKAAIEIYRTLLNSVEKSDSFLRSKILYELAVSYCNLTPPDYRSALPNANESFEIDASKNLSGFFLSADLLAKIFRQIGEIEGAQELYKKMSMSSNNDSDYYAKYQQAVILNNYSIILRHTGQIDDAMQYADKAISLFSEIGDFDGVVKSTISVSTILMESGRIDESIDKLREIEKIAKDLDSFRDLCSIYNELGVAFRYKGDLKSAIDYHKRAADLAQEMNFQEELSRQYYNIAVCEINQGHESVALDFNNKSFKIRDKLEEGETKWSGMSENFQLYGRLFLEKGQFESAKNSYRKSIKYAEKVNYAQVICDSCCNLLTLAMLERNDSEVELYHKRLYYLLTEKYKMPDRWKQVEMQISLYRLLKV